MPKETIALGCVDQVKVPLQNLSSEVRCGRRTDRKHPLASGRGIKEHVVQVFGQVGAMISTSVAAAWARPLGQGAMDLASWAMRCTAWPAGP